MTLQKSEAQHSVADPDAPGEPVKESFTLTGVWLFVGILAVVLGITAGLVMSAATFVK